MLGYIDHLSFTFVQASKGNLTRGDVSGHDINPFFVGDIKYPELLCNSVAFTPGKMFLDVDYEILYNYLWYTMQAMEYRKILELLPKG